MYRNKKYTQYIKYNVIMQLTQNHINIGLWTYYIYTWLLAINLIYNYNPYPIFINIPE